MMGWLVESEGDGQRVGRVRVCCESVIESVWRIFEWYQALVSRWARHARTSVSERCGFKGEGARTSWLRRASGFGNIVTRSLSSLSVPSESEQGRRVSEVFAEAIVSSSSSANPSPRLSLSCQGFTLVRQQLTGTTASHVRTHFPPHRNPRILGTSHFPPSPRISNIHSPTAGNLARWTHTDPVTAHDLADLGTEGVRRAGSRSLGLRS